MNTDMLVPLPDYPKDNFPFPIGRDDFPFPIGRDDFPHPVLHPSFEPVPELPSLENASELFQNHSLVDSMHHNQTNDWCIVQ